MPRDSRGFPRRHRASVNERTIHRHPALWSEPARFDPDRFLPAEVAKRSRYAYLPFGDGPRICIGKAFAIMESKLLLAMIAREARLDMEPARRVEPLPSVTLRPLGGMPMRYSKIAAPVRTAGADQAGTSA